jgi:long-chain acyl-CoA synthetase
MILSRLFDLILNQNKNNSLDLCLSSNTEAYSTSEVVSLMNRLSIGLDALGLKKGDHIAIASDSCPAWTITDFALQQLGMVSIPIYPTATEDDIRYVLSHAEVKLVFVGNQTLRNKIFSALPSKDTPIYSFSSIQNDTPHWKDLCIQNITLENQKFLEQQRKQIQPDDLFTIIYTSGTTGRSKGVMLSHNNVLSNAQASAEFSKMPHGVCRAVSFLPLSHIFERTGVFYYILTATSIRFCSVEQLSSTLKDFKPHTFNTVPRILEKVHEKFTAQSKNLKGLKKILYIKAIKFAESYEPSLSDPLQNLMQKFYHRLVYKHWVDGLGGHIQWLPVGSAALQSRLARLFRAAGVRISEGYGLSETSPVLTATPFENAGVRIGSVGIPIPGVTIQLADDGEILVKSPGVMLGYYREKELTAEALKDGWFHTGDIGEWVNGYLRITDRKKEMFKISNGKYVAPQVIENKMKESAFIDQIMVVGDGQKFASALIVPLFDRLKEWCSEHGIMYTCDEEMTCHPKVIRLMEREIKRFNHHFGSWEHVKKFVLLHRPWSVDTGELAPTLKLRRKVILARFQHMIDGMYTQMMHYSS